MRELLLEKLNWRYATKIFDPNKKVSDEDFEVLLEALRLSPSSFGLQPWKFVVVKNQAIRESLIEHSWGQRQVADASHLIVLCCPKSVDESTVDKYIEFTAESRGIDASTLSGFADMMKGFLSRMNENQKSNWMKDQAYIALGNLMTCAAMIGIDACPMEGFSAPDYDKIIGLDQMDLTSVVLCPVGYRSSEDKYADYPKVRYPSEDVILEIA